MDFYLAEKLETECICFCVFLAELDLRSGYRILTA